MSRAEFSGSNSTDYLKRAWIWLFLMLVGQLAGQLVGHLISSALGHGEETPFVGPLWQKLLIVVPSSFLIITPGFVSAFYGRKVIKQGQRIGYLHLYVGGIFSLMMTLVFVLTTLGVGQ